MLMNRGASGLIVPQHMVEDQTPSDGFMRKLQSIFGQDMHVEWNVKKQRWVVEVCIRHYAQPKGDGFVKHNHLCQRSYAWLVRDEETDEYMPLCDRVIEKLHEKDTSRKYGVGEAALKRFYQESKDFDDEQEYRRKLRSQEVIKNSRKDNRLTWNKFRTMFTRHDLRPHTK